MEWLTSLAGTFDIFSHLAALAFAYALALPIAWDRERHERSAGLRTFPLVAIAACGFIQATEGITLGNAEATARIVEGLINGVGFIGGGAILVGKAGTRGRQRLQASGPPARSALLSGLEPMTRRSFFRS